MESAGAAGILPEVVENSVIRCWLAAWLLAAVLAKKQVEKNVNPLVVFGVWVAIFGFSFGAGCALGKVRSIDDPKSDPVCLILKHSVGHPILAAAAFQAALFALQRPLFPPQETLPAGLAFCLV